MTPAVPVAETLGVAFYWAAIFAMAHFAGRYR